jgi:hypothetical protein
MSITINIVEGDSELNPDTAKIVAEQMVANEAVIGVIGPVGSQECEATQPVFTAVGLAHVTPSCTATALTQPGTRTFFRPIPNDAEQSKTIAAYLLDTLAVSAVYVVDDQSSYSVSLSDEVEVLLVEGGVLIGIVFLNIRHTMGFLAGLKGFTAAVIGGIGSIPGAVLGGLLLGMTEVFATVYISATFKDVIAFLILLAVLLIRPSGFLGRSLIEKV